METIDYVVLYVRDLEASIAFYRDVIGLPFKLQDSGYGEFATRGTKFGLYQRARLPGLIGRQAGSGGPAGEVLFLVDDVDAEAERLRGQGVEILAGPSTGRGGTAPSTSSTRTGSSWSWPRRSRASGLARADVAGDRDGRVSAILAYHEATKHSPESVRRRFHRLDWDNKPHTFKVYPGLDRVDLPDDVPSLDVPALETIAAVAAPRPAPGPDLASLARLLLYGAGVHHALTFPGGDVTRFRNYASAGALYPVEVYVACADLAGLPAGVYHFDPAGPSPASGRATTGASWSARPPPSRPWPGPRPCSPSPASPGGPRGSTPSAGTATCSGTPA